MGITREQLAEINKGDLLRIAHEDGESDAGRFEVYGKVWIDSCDDKRLGYLDFGSAHTLGSSTILEHTKAEDQWRSAQVVRATIEGQEGVIALLADPDDGARWKVAHGAVTNSSWLADHDLSDVEIIVDAEGRVYA